MKFVLFFQLFMINSQYTLITPTINDWSMNLIIKVLVYQFVYIILLYDKPKCLSICLYHFDV